MRTVVLLILSNLFMTAAWYGHLRFKSTRLAVVILASWLIALPEYMLQVPANRWGHGRFSAAQLKIMQEIISLCVFLVFSLLYLRERPSWRELAGMALIVAAVALVFRPHPPHPAPPPAALAPGSAEPPPILLPGSVLPGSGAAGDAGHRPA